MKMLALHDRLRSLLLALCCMAAFGTSQAALIDNGSYTTDTDSGQDWLDFSVTLGMSYNDVAAQMVTGGAFEGWRFATNAEITNYWNNAGGSGAYSGFDVGNKALVDSMVNLMGYTYYISSFWYGIQALTAEVGTSGPTTTDMWYCFCEADKGWTALSYLNTTYDNKDPDIASWLVRGGTPVPAPSALLLMLVGLVGLRRIRR